MICSIVASCSKDSFFGLSNGFVFLGRISVSLDFERFLFASLHGFLIVGTGLSTDICALNYMD